MSAHKLVDVGAFDDFEDAVATAVAVDGKELVVIRWEDRFYALRSMCPHQSQSFRTGRVSPRITATPDGEIALGGPVLSCPWHYWPFDVESGQCVVDRRKRVKTYPVRVERDRVFVELADER